MSDPVSRLVPRYGSFLVEEQKRFPAVRLPRVVDRTRKGEVDTPVNATSPLRHSPLVGIFRLDTSVDDGLRSEKR